MLSLFMLGALKVGSVLAANGDATYLQTCSPARAQYQVWKVNPDNKSNNIILASNGQCLDVSSYSTVDMATIQIWVRTATFARS
jgi:hypothetical protein